MTEPLSPWAAGGLAVRQSDLDGPVMLIIARLASDPAFASALAAATTPQDAQRIAAGHGFDVTPVELAAASSIGDLSDADLEAVSGGKTTSVPPNWC